MNINNKYQIGQIVYLKTDDQQLNRMVLAVQVRANNQIVYTLASGADESFHFEMEISTDKNILI